MVAVKPQDVNRWLCPKMCVYQRFIRHKKRTWHAHVFSSPSHIVIWDKCCNKCAKIPLLADFLVGHHSALPSAWTSSRDFKSKESLGAGRTPFITLPTWDILGVFQNRAWYSLCHWIVVLYAKFEVHSRWWIKGTRNWAVGCSKWPMIIAKCSFHGNLDLYPSPLIFFTFLSENQVPQVPKNPMVYSDVLPWIGALFIVAAIFWQTNIWTGKLQTTFKKNDCCHV